MERWISCGGVLVMGLLAWGLSSRRRAFPWRVVIGGMTIQLVLALLILETTGGRLAFEWLGRCFRELLGFVDVGSAFVFGKEFEKVPIAFQVLPTIIFFSALTSVLYHFRILPLIVRMLGALLRRTLGTSGAESLCAAANIFVGMTEAPLVVRPYLARMTRSEITAVMTGGFATLAGGVLAVYVGMGIDPTDLIAASVISAPAALVMAKIMEPETQRPETAGGAGLSGEPRSVNVLHAVTLGAGDGVRLAINVAAMLIVFLALIALVNGALGGVGNWFGVDLSLERLLGWLGAPFAWLMGVEAGDCPRVGELLGLKVVTNEFIAYDRLASWGRDGAAAVLSERSRTIVTFALCGFSNFGSIGVQLGGLGPLVPERQADLAKLVVRAMIGGVLATFTTACIAGIVI